MGCKVTLGLDLACTSLLQTGGSKPRFWVGNLGDLSTPIDVTSTTALTALTFKTYKGLHAYTGPKEGHSFGWNEVLAQGGNRAIQHQAIIKLFSASNANNDVIRTLLAAQESFLVAEHNNRTFQIYGAQNGMESSAGAQSQGVNNSQDVSNQITLQGNGEEYLPLFFLDTDYSTTLAKLVGYEV